jgi:hypothetical protein
MKCMSLMTIGIAIVMLCTGTASAADCDRECLRGMITRYLDAMAAHNANALPLASGVRFTEDTVDMKLGEGLWKQLTKLRPYRLDTLDVAQGVAASQAVVEESGSPVMLMLRLKVIDRNIAEVETQVTRSQTEGAIFAVEALQAPNSAMVAPIDPKQRNSRVDAIRIAEHCGWTRNREFCRRRRAVRRGRLPLRERPADGRQGLHVPAAGVRRH